MHMRGDKIGRVDVEDKPFITSTRIAKSRDVTKPNYLGVFCLSYSKIIMFDHYKKCTGELKNIKNIFYYTDTDSICIHSSAISKYKVITSNKIGDLHDEYPGKRIIEAYVIMPKVYYLNFDDESEVVTRNGIDTKKDGKQEQ